MKKLVACLLIAALLIFCGGLIYFSHERKEAESSHILSGDRLMPSVFEGFTERWNRQALSWLEEEKKRVEGKLINWKSSHDPRAGTTVLMLEKELNILKERLAMGDMVRELPLSELPKGLAWQDGQEEPDIGDERARKGGGITLWNAAPFPSTLREFGHGSLNYFYHSLYRSVSLGLVSLHPETGRPIPGVACAWAVANDGKSIFYKLDSRARYSNGQAVRAKDFLLGMCLRVSDFAKDPYWINRYRDSMASLSTYGENVIAVTLPHAVPLMPYMAARDLYAASPAFYKDFDASFPESFQWRAAPTTGGYTVLPADIHFGRSIVIRRVKDWWAKDLKFYRNSCNVDRVEHRFIGEESIAIELFRQGKIDAMATIKPEVWSGKFESPEFLNGYMERVTLKTEYPRPTYGILLNTAMPALKNMDVRRGILHALDMDSVIQSVFQGSYSRLLSYADGYGELTKAIESPRYSPEAARACFARGGFTQVGDDGILVNSSGEKLSVALTYASFSPTMRAVCELLRQRGLACGVEIRLDGLESSVCARKVLEKRHELALWAEPGNWPFPDLYRIFHSSLARDEQGRLVTHTNNLCSLADEKMDSLLMEERWAKDSKSLERALHAVQQQLDALCVWSPGWKENGIRIAFWGWVCWPDSEETNFCPLKINDPLDTHLYWIDPVKKKKILEAKKNEMPLPVVEKVVGSGTRSGAILAEKQRLQ